MDLKKIIFICGLLIILLNCVSGVFALEDNTNISMNDNEIECYSIDELNVNNENKLNEQLDNENLLSDFDPDYVEDFSFAGTFTDYNGMEQRYGWSIDTSISDKSVNFQSNKNLEVKFTNSSSKQPLYHYAVLVGLHDYNEDGGGVSDEFSGYTDSEGIFKVPLKNMWAADFTISVHVMLHEDGGFYNDDIGHLVIKKVNPTISAKKIQGNTASTILKVTVKDSNGKPINDEWARIKFVVNGKSYTVDVDNGIAKKKIKLPKAKTYTYKATLISDNYKSKTVSSKIVVKQSKAKITTKKSSCYSGEYATLKAIVKDSAGKKLNEGFIKFTINGKSYKVSVKNGVAQKKVKLTSVGTHTYNAIFSSSYYVTKQSNSKVIVKKAPTYTVKVGKYSIKISYGDYKKIKKAESSGQFSKKYYTGKTIMYKVFKDKKVVHTKKKIYMDTWQGGYKTYNDGYYAPEGYTYYGTEAKKVGNHIKRYAVYKKTTYKKVLVKTPQTKVYIIIDSNPWWGASAELYYKEYDYYDKYGGVETKNYVGNPKSIF